MNNLNTIFNQLESLLKQAYCPYSNYHVACVVETELGLFSGVNVECGAYPLTICAEKNAISSAITAGSKEFKKIYLLTDSLDILGTPCGGCRQFISEFYSENSEIVVFNRKKEYKVIKIKELLPYAWKSSTLFSK